MKSLGSAFKQESDVFNNSPSIKSYSEKNLESEIKKSFHKLIPKTLLTKALPPEKINLLDEDEKRLYNIQKGKYDTYVRILEKKAKTNEHPLQKRFSLAEVDLLMTGKHHEVESDDEEEDANWHMAYLSRPENFF